VIGFHPEQLLEIHRSEREGFSFGDFTVGFKSGLIIRAVNFQPDTYSMNNNKPKQRQTVCYEHSIALQYQCQR
jgi:hypothetical protein